MHLLMAPGLFTTETMMKLVWLFWVVAAVTAAKEDVSTQVTTLTRQSCNIPKVTE
jgi:hypothetical protein